MAALLSSTPSRPARAPGERAAERALLARLTAVAPAEPARPESAEAWSRHRAAARERLRASLGVPAPGRCDGRVAGTVDRGAYRVDRIALSGAFGVPIPALLWYPVRAEPVPVVVSLIGHFASGKDDPAVQARARGLVARGMATLVLEPWGWGERTGLMRGHDEGYELFAADTSLLGVEVADVTCALDYLATRKEVDATRVGVAGESGGGTLALHAAALDDRIGPVAVTAALNTAAGDLVSGECPCNYVPGLLPFADTADVAALHAPRPLLVGIGLLDEFLLPDVSRTAARRVRATYEALGAGSRLVVVELPEGHDYGPAFAAEAGRFLESELAPVTPVEVPDEGPFAGEALAVFAATDDRGPAAPAIVAAAQRALAPVAPLAPGELRSGLARVLGMEAVDARVVRGSASRADGTAVRAVSLAVGADLVLEGRIVEPEAGATRATLLWLSPRGSQATSSSEAVRALASAGHRVACADLRAQDGAAAGRDERALLHLSQAAGRPLLGQRLADAALWLTAMEGEAGGPVIVVGEAESAALGVLLAAAGAPRAVVALDLPATLLADERRPGRWGLPPSLAVTGLSALGDVPDWLGASSRPVLVLRPRRRSGGEVHPGDTEWTALATSSATVAVETWPDSLAARIAAFAADQPRR